MKHLTLSACLLLLASCQSNSPDRVELGSAGASVAEVCYEDYNRRIVNWQPLEDNSVILRLTHDYFQIILEDSCDTRLTKGSAIGVSGGNIRCLDLNDDIIFSNNVAQSCDIKAINVWNVAPR